RGDAGDAADHNRGLDDPRGGGRDGGAGRAERRLAGGAGRYGAGDRTDRIDRALGQPLDRRHEQGPDLEPKLILHRKNRLSIVGVRPSRATRRRYVWTGPNPLSALTSSIPKRLRADASGGADGASRREVD